MNSIQCIRGETAASTGVASVMTRRTRQDGGRLSRAVVCSPDGITTRPDAAIVLKSSSDVSTCTAIAPSPSVASVRSAVRRTL